MGSVRIISGKFKGRKINVRDEIGLRPTTDRVRETVFNWLQFDINGSRCLDLFGGSGVMSFEALSRYAQFATIIELNKRVVLELKDNIVKFNVENIKVIQADAIKFVSQKNTDMPYNIVFIDPPFRFGFIDKLVDNLNDNGYLADNAYIYVEHEVESTPRIPINWKLLKNKNAGQVSYNLYQKDVQFLE